METKKLLGGSHADESNIINKCVKDSEGDKDVSEHELMKLKIDESIRTQSFARAGKGAYPSAKSKIVTSIESLLM